MGFFATLINGYKIMGQETGAYIQKNRAQLASGASIIGTIVSNIMSTKAGAKSARTIDAKEAELGRPLSKVEKVKLVWTNHIAPSAVATGSCISAVYSNNEHVKNFNQLGTAYGVLKRAYDSTQKATREVLGEKKAAKLQDEINEKYIEQHPEVKKKIISCNENPDPHTMQKYFDKATGITFHSTKDRIESALKSMQNEMRALPPRNKNVPGRSGIYGIPLKRFHELANPNITLEQLESDMMCRNGFNKGKERNGTDDDIIAVTYIPKLINGDTEAVIMLEWEQEPSDMAYGDFVKL